MKVTEEQFEINKTRSEKNITTQLNKRIKWFENENKVKVKSLIFYRHPDKKTFKKVEIKIEEEENDTKS